MLRRVLMGLVLVRSPVVAAAKLPSRPPTQSARALNGTRLQAIRSARNVPPVVKLSTCTEALLVNSAISAEHAAALSPYRAVLWRLRGGTLKQLPRLVRCIPPALLIFAGLLCMAHPAMKSDGAKFAWSMVLGGMLFPLCCSLLRVSHEEAFLLFGAAVFCIVSLALGPYHGASALCAMFTGAHFLPHDSVTSPR